MTKCTWTEVDRSTWETTCGCCLDESDRITACDYLDATHCPWCGEKFELVYRQDILNHAECEWGDAMRERAMDEAMGW